MLLVLLCLVISVLLYIRTRIVDRLRRDQGRPQEQAEQRQGDGGVFPPPGDPARNEWAILR
jgi:SEL1 protein